MAAIRNERKEDFRTVEELTKKAFWNVNFPGCNEHYIVHVMRNHRDFVPELDFVIEEDNCIIGNIMYTKSKLIDESGNEKEILTFGPLSILPEYQRRGYGKQLLEHSFKKAAELGFDTIVIFGNPENYVSCGFKSCKTIMLEFLKMYFLYLYLLKNLKLMLFKEKTGFIRKAMCLILKKKMQRNLTRTSNNLKRNIGQAKNCFISIAIHLLKLLSIKFSICTIRLQ